VSTNLNASADHSDPALSATVNKPGGQRP